MTLKDKGNSFYQSGHWSEAERFYTAGLREHGLSPEAKVVLLCNRSATLLKLGRAKDALQDARQALNLLPGGHAKSSFRAAQALEAMQDPRAAVVSLRECLSRQPGSDPAKALLRRLQAQLSVQCQAPGADELRRAACVTPPTGWDWRYMPSQDGCSQNLMLMLHGLGDSPEPYASLAQSLKIPQTDFLAIRGPLAVPFTENGRCWYDAFDADFEILTASSAGKQRIAGLESVCTSLRALIVRHLFEKGAWHPSQCHVLGFSQGGTVALELTRLLEPGLGLGSCVAVSAGLLPEWLHAHSKSTEVPRERSEQGEGVSRVMLTYDPCDHVVPEREVLATKAYLESRPGRYEVQARPFSGRGHKFWASREEGLAIVEFWSQALSWRPPGSVSDADSTFVEIRPGTLQDLGPNAWHGPL
ncbi:hypothetical protein ACKKBG_A08535 [Auxenochlorella protothecoides x Auxenochlorella symbiontica]